MSLVGRESELKYLDEAIAGIEERGGVVVIAGEAGIGKTALLQAVTTMATLAGVRTVTVTATEAEQQLPYAGLHQIVFPLRSGLDALPPTHAAALNAALGFVDAAAPNEYLIGSALLTLLSDRAAEQPLLLVVEDVHWLDAATSRVLAFLARRLESEPILLIASTRDADTALTPAGHATLALSRLAEEEARQLLDTVAPGLDNQRRERVLAAAAGNPLALKELPSAADRPDAPLPLTERLERAFGLRADQLPETTRTALLLAALDELSVPETLAAAALLTDGPIEDAELTPAVAAGLIEIDSGAVRFRHPLMRSAIPAAAQPAARRAAHHALASTLRDQPDRAARHHAAAVVGPDDTAAAELEAAAERALRRGGVAAAITTLEHAAHLTETPAVRVGRLLRAAELAVESGGRETVDRLLREAGRQELDPRGRALATWLVSGFDDGVGEDPARTTELATLAETVAAEGDRELALRILWGTAMRCFWSEPGPDARRALLAVADGMGLPAGDPRLVAITAYVAPVERGATVFDQLRALAGRTGADPEVDRYLGSAALQIGAFVLAGRFSATAITGLREQGRLGLLTRALAVRAWSCARTGDLAGGAAAAAEAERLGPETGQHFMYGLAVAVAAEIAALRGDFDEAAHRADEAERIGAAAGARPVLATVQRARALVALGQGRYDDALADLRRILDPADPAYQLALRAYIVGDLVEAAVRAGRVEEAAEIVREFEEHAPRTPSPALHVGLRYARALLASADAAEELFTAALDADPDGWPLERARVELAFGEWLRRQRRIVESRAHLRAARDTFDALGARPWGERARRELRGAGETSPRRDPDARDSLTPHELGIAQLAAEGLTNREIGQRLYLSHRTVSTHLHRIFPKLGVTSRAELADALRTSADPVT
ncbi:putative HTH-type transcriptional regulator [Nocardia cerradoensis]|uniref:Putative HTH-type transcriptional regulator n=1 Tax=Nocardia cerradoensis TaxID=85688 RepID=A0A231GW16_9NOCA|nr:LuxR family transcriptional regulator [Nocardia cerradoensis]OXR40681.1 putative HTH-type transcriptional regulator [Nocardia cerradoensis]